MRATHQGLVPSSLMSSANKADRLKAFSPWHNQAIHGQLLYYSKLSRLMKHNQPNSLIIKHFTLPVPVARAAHCQSMSVHNPQQE